MKKITFLTAFLFSLIGFSQANRQNIQAYLDANRTKFDLTAADVSDWAIVGEASSTSTKINNYRIVQMFQGIEIYDTQTNVWVKNNEVINAVSRFKTNIAGKVNSTSGSLNVVQAMTSAYSKLGITGQIDFKLIEKISTNRYTYSDGLQEETISAKKVYQFMNDKLKLAWQFQIHTPDSKHFWDVRIDANSGQILEKNDLVISCSFGHQHNQNSSKYELNSFEKTFFKNFSSPAQVNSGSYRVIPYNYTSPNHSPFQLIANPHNTVASPRGWHNSNTLTGTNAAAIYTTTRGNNIAAQEDADGNDGSGLRPEGTASLTFDFPFAGPTNQPTVYTNASTTNLFYMTNIMHDVWHRYGFDEPNGNFQRQNYGRGGVITSVGDPVNADSQNGYLKTTPDDNNANFLPSNDGVSPRIQMFMWTAGAPPTDYIKINAPSSIAGSKQSTTNVFEGTDRIPVPPAPGITRDLVLLTSTPLDPLQNPNSACGPITNAAALNDKIVLLKRGGCFFSNKVKKAQDAGAVAVIVMDTIVNNPQRLNMSSTGLLGITIPAVFVSTEIGNNLIAALNNGPVNATIEVSPGLYLYADGSFDNTIIAHEYGHGISNRLVGGGLAGCMNNYDQMGEGWSDWFGLMMQLKTGDIGTTPLSIGTYVFNQANNGAGLRDYPYSTDMAIDPRTLNSTNTPIPTDPANTAYRYKSGEFWTSVLWDLTWKYIEKYGYDADIYNGTGGNNKIMRLVLDALKLENCNATNIITSRNNLFAAEQATTNGVDYCMIAEVFARRGVGLNATSGSVDDCNDQLEDFTPFLAGPNCVLSVNYFENSDMLRVSPNPSSGLYNIRINNFVGKLNIEVIDINGRLIYNTKDQEFNVEKTIDLSQFQSGVYVLKISGENVNYSQKLIKN